MGKTIAEKIIEAHLVCGEMKKGEDIGIRIDQTLTQDATGTMAYLEFEAMGVDLAEQIDNPDKKRDCVFMQISEASNSRAIRTERFKYEVRDIAVTGYAHHRAKVYFENYLYDLKKDPNEKYNLIKDPRYRHIRQELKYLLLKQMQDAQEEAPVIFPAVIKRRK